MDEFDAVARIRELCQLRSWTYYRLAKKSGIPYSTLSTMLHKTTAPSIPTLMKICHGFGISLSEFFSPTEPLGLAEDQIDCLSRWNTLDDDSKPLALAYMDGLASRQK